jgi:class 3 adenylate cyclase
LIESQHDIPFSPEEVWPILSNTDWLNRAIGLPPVSYEYAKRPEGGSHVTASARVLGREWRWREIPFEWCMPEYYRVRRIFETGMLKESLLGLDFIRTATGTRIISRGKFLARNRVSRFLIRRLLGPKTSNDMAKAIAHAESYLKGRAKVSLPKLPVQPVNKPALEAALKKLRATGQPEDFVQRLGIWLQESPDVELTHIRPFAVARGWKQDRWDVLRLFLHATRSGLLDLSWEILCPNCRTARKGTTKSLAGLANEAHCDYCQIQYNAEFDKSVELKFCVNPGIRRPDDQTFCMAGPGGKPHVVSQIWLEPKERREWHLPALEQPVRLQSTQINQALSLKPSQIAANAPSLEISCEPEGFKILSQSASKEAPSLSMLNPNPFPILASLETVDWNSDILTAARATNWQEFRDLFVNEVLSPNEKISVGSQIIMFTDLRGSTAMYQNVGDAAAYSMVRDHFVFMMKAISDNHGTVIKTMGDAVMASFSLVEDALKAVQEFHREFKKFQTPKPGAKPGEMLALKTGMHIGPCLAVNANGQLDYFGSTVNLAARLVSSCKGNDIAISEELFARPEIMEFMGSLDLIPEMTEIKFRGFDEPHRVWRLQMD